jgi:hypothetical protein
VLEQTALQIPDTFDTCQQQCVSTSLHRLDNKHHFSIIQVASVAERERKEPHHFYGTGTIERSGSGSDGFDQLQPCC